MGHIDGRHGLLTLVLLAAASIATIIHRPAHADGGECSRTASQLAQVDETKKAETLHRCPKFTPDYTRADFFVGGDLPFTEDEEQAKADVIEQFTRNCPSGTANVSRVKLVPMEQGGKRYWAFLAMGHCL